MKNPYETEPLYKEIFATPEEVTEAIDLLAKRLIEDYRGKSPLFVGLWKGGMLFSTRLMAAITAIDPYFHPELDGMTVTRYGNELTGRQPHLAMDLSPKTDVTGRPVIVLDDIIDGGDTFTYTKKLLEAKGAREVSLAVLVQREVPGRELNADYYCFSFPTDEWLTGMGLDDPRIEREANRWAGYIAIAKQLEA